jgi:hypothetical protein
MQFTLPCLTVPILGMQVKGTEGTRRLGGNNQKRIEDFLSSLKITGQPTLFIFHLALNMVREGE